MLQKVGDFFKKGSVAGITLAIISAALLITGKGLADRFAIDLPGGSPHAAEGAGIELAPERAREALQNEQNRLQQAGVDLEDPKVLEQTKSDVLERLILSELVALRGTEQGYRVGAAAVQDYIRSEPAFQVDGKYSESLALARLAQVGATPETYRRDVRRTLESQELSRTIGLGEFVTPVESGRRLALEGELREVRYATFAAEQFLKSVSLTPAEISGWYEKNGDRFATPESVRMELISASLADVESQVSVSEEDIKAAYAARVDQFQQGERRRVRHILLDSEKTARDALAQLKSGADFAELARKLSKDSGSSSSGGDLGLSGRDAFVKPFADAAFALQQGATSEPVKTEFGFHIIRVDTIEAGNTQAYETVRASLETELRKDRAIELLSDLEERIERRVEQGGVDLSTLAAEFKLPLRVVEKFSRQGDAAVSRDPAFIELVFGDEQLVQRRIGGPVQLGQDAFAVFHVVDHQKSVVPPLDAVRPQVVAALTRERAVELARAAAEQVATTVKTSGSVTAGSGSWQSAGFVTRRETAVPEAIRATAFSLPRPAAEKVSAGAVSLPDGAAVAVVSAIRAAPPAEDIVRRLRLQALQFEQGQTALAAYVADLRAKAEVLKNLESF
jgi:peptidyl-prolyl cis-trans isomerase D